MRTRPHVIALTLLLAAVSTACANATGDGSYYSETFRGREGWYGYEKEKPKKKDKAKKKASPAQEPMRLLSRDELKKLDVEALNKYIDRLEKKAISSPTEENVYHYWEAWDVGRKKAHSFTAASQYIWQKYPELTTERDNPTSNPGKLALHGIRTDEMQQKLRSNADSYALLYFYSPTCSFCDTQSSINRYFTDITGWTIKGIDITQNPTLAARFNINTTPTMLLISKGRDDWFPIASGVTTMDDLEKRVFRAVRLLNGETKPEDYTIYDYQKGGAFDPSK